MKVAYLRLGLKVYFPRTGLTVACTDGQIGRSSSHGRSFSVRPKGLSPSREPGATAASDGMGQPPLKRLLKETVWDIRYWMLLV